MNEILQLFMQNPELLNLLQATSATGFPMTGMDSSVLHAGRSPAEVYGTPHSSPQAASAEKQEGDTYEPIMAALGDEELQRLLAPQQQQPMLPGAGVHSMNIAGLLQPYAPPPVSLGGLFGNFNR